MNISGVVLTKNEERNIADCLKSLDFCDEVLVIDDNSNDKTVDIAKKTGAVVFKRKLNADFAGQRNFGLKKAKGRWVLFIDADERVSDILKKEITEKINSKPESITGYRLKRTDYLYGKKINYGETGSFKILRLARKGAGKWERNVHEKWNVFGNTKVLKNPILHYPHPNLRGFIKDVNNYSTLHAKANYSEHKKSSLFKIIFMPTAKFIYNFIIKLGFLDGERGLIIAFLMSLHSFLAWSKLWLIQKKPYQK